MEICSTISRIVGRSAGKVRSTRRIGGQPRSRISQTLSENIIFAIQKILNSTYTSSHCTFEITDFLIERSNRFSL